MADERHSTRNGHVSLKQILESVAAEFGAMLGRPLEGISSAHRVDGGWKLEIEVLEMDRIPPSTSLVATYELEIDEDGNLSGYRRLRRYYRNQADKS
jgi:hypothetical protein